MHHQRDQPMASRRLRDGAGLAVLHYRHDYFMIASLTGQSTTWIARRGSVL
jgi:hypothetical protein